MADRRKINKSKIKFRMPLIVKTVLSDKPLYSTKGDILHPFIFPAKPIFSDAELYFFIMNILNHTKSTCFNC